MSDRTLTMTSRRLRILREVRDGKVTVAPRAELAAGTVRAGSRVAYLTAAGKTLLAEMERPGR